MVRSAFKWPEILRVLVLTSTVNIKHWFSPVKGHLYLLLCTSSGLFSLCLIWSPCHRLSSLKMCVVGFSWSNFAFLEPAMEKIQLSTVAVGSWNTIVPELKLVRVWCGLWRENKMGPSVCSLPFLSCFSGPEVVIAMLRYWCSYAQLFKMAEGGGNEEVIHLNSFRSHSGKGK